VLICFDNLLFVFENKNSHCTPSSPREISTWMKFASAMVPVSYPRRGLEKVKESWARLCAVPKLHACTLLQTRYSHVNECVMNIVLKQNVNGQSLRRNLVYKTVVLMPKTMCPVREIDRIVRSTTVRLDGVSYV
jgi:hypothetical protein